MTKSNKSTSYAISVDSAHKQAREAQELYNLAKSLLETYLCGDQPVRYRESAVRLLIDHSYNSKMYGETLRDYIETGERVKNKKTGKENIVVDVTGFTLVNAYLTVISSCENELETLGISMRTH
tara:strand:+ start:1944 stop:2315 length:372 start_codon:yes stop_codon:yes gene_type:complete